MNYHERRRPSHPSPASIETLVRTALAEDVGDGDLTAVLIDAGTRCTARVQAREPAVLCGQAWFDAVFRALDPRVKVSWLLQDGQDVDDGSVVCTLQGPARAINTGERTALNLLQTLSGTATAARRHARAVAGTGTTILDTRKTLPGLRVAQKYAVVCGGCGNHRMGLFDAMLIKENHVIAAGGVGQAVKAARTAHPDAPLEVEVEDLQQLHTALELGVEMILLDNFSDADTLAAVSAARGRARLEASGGVTDDALARLASLGVDYISVGALTKHLQAVDFSMRVD